MMDGHERRRSDGTRCEGTDGSSRHHVSYQVMAALERREELEKVRLAQILHDLHRLAKSKSNQNDRLRKRGTMRRMWHHIAIPKKSSGGDCNEHSSFASSTCHDNTNNDDLLQLSLEELQAMTPSKTYDLMTKLEKGERFSVASLMNVLSAARDVCMKEETLIDLRDKTCYERIHIVGDLHGSLASLEHVLKIVGGIVQKDTAYIFNGDFVDRGENSLEVLLILLLLKITYPENVFLIRGNHEDTLVCSVYGFHEELMSKYGYDDATLIWEQVSSAFCAMPLSVVTKHSFIAHGGIPSANFHLDQLKSISAERRSNIKSIVDPENDVDEMVQGLLWSDPTTANGIQPNTNRSLGVFFGPDVSSDFLERHDLHYIIRAHELTPNGTATMDCGDDRSVVTVFSQPGYCNQNNLGAVVHLNKDGSLDQTIFSSNMAEATRDSHKNDEEHYLQSLRELIEVNRTKLEKAFAEEAPDGSVPTTRWASIMAKTLELDEVPWMILSTDLTPPSFDRSTVDWKEFIQSYASKTQRRRRRNTAVSIDNDEDEENHKTSNQELVSMESSHAKQDMIMTTFQFLDSDGTGSIDANKFRVGVNLLNRRLHRNKRFENPDALFDQMDKDGSGDITLEELRELFKTM